jgi:glycosyltransferase involved in cell wall biosynthesis
VLQHLALCLREQAEVSEIELVTLYHTDRAGTLMQSAGISVHCLGLKSKYDPLGVPRLVRLVRSRTPDLVHAHLFPAGYFAALASFCCPRVPWIYTEHSSWNRRRAYWPLRLLESALYHRFDRVIAVSNKVEVSLTTWLPGVRSKTECIPNGVPLSLDARAWPLGTDSVPERPTILYVGRLSSIKGVDLLLQAFSQLRAECCELKIAGEGDLRPSLEAQTAELGLQNTVEFVGLHTDVQSLMSDAYCLVLPSRWEGLPMVLLEAMAVGLPVIATAVGGIPEVINHGSNGLLVPPEDPKSLAQALMAVLEDPQMARRIGQRARERIVETYSIEAMAQRTLGLYSRVLDESKSTL